MPKDFKTAITNTLNNLKVNMDMVSENMRNLSQATEDQNGIYRTEYYIRNEGQMALAADKMFKTKPVFLRVDQ